VSISVDLAELQAEASRFGAGALLVTTSTAGPPHVSSVLVTFDGEELAMRVGRKTRVNVSEHAAITLVWMSGGDPDYCLIVDALAREEAEETIVAHPTSAVLHRLAGGATSR
jgi:hypothetical protein